jgi:hypothetical protein
MSALTRQELDRSGCGTPNCQHDHSVLYLEPRCHVGAGVFAKYTKATGAISFSCAKCRKPIIEIAVREN